MGYFVVRAVVGTQESVGDRVCFSLEPLAVFPDSERHVVHCVHSCRFEAGCSLDWVVAELAEVSLAEPTSDVVLSVMDSAQSPGCSRSLMISIQGVMIAARCSS